MLRNLGFDALPIHGQMSQPKRLGALNKFKAGERSILVATGESCALLVGESTALPSLTQHVPTSKYSASKHGHDKVDVIFSWSIWL